jgi:phage tail sheath gpL-like
MTVPFSATSSDERVPLFSAELNAGTPPYSGVSRTLLIGRMLTGSAVVGTPVNIGNSDPVALFGNGSMLARAAATARYFNPEGAIFALPIAAPTGSPGTATGNLSFTGPATGPGTFTRYIDGEAYSCGVAAGDSATTIAANWRTAVLAGYTKYGRQLLPPVVAAIDGTNAYQINLTARHSGPEGNYIRIDAGLNGDEVDPPGVAATVTAIAGGTGTIDMAATLALLGNEPFDWIVAGPYNTAQNLTDADTFLADSGGGRWSPSVGLFGHYFCFHDGNLSSQTSLGTSRNGKHVSIVSGNAYAHGPTTYMAAIGGLWGFSKNLGADIDDAAEIARPMQTLPLTGLKGPADRTKRWGKADRQALYTSGIGALIFAPDGTPQIERLPTTYQTSPAGAPDQTFLDTEAMAITQYVIQYMRNKLVEAYPRHVLRDDNPNGLGGVVTVKDIRATIIHLYTDLAYRGGLVENVELFAKYLIVERADNAYRVNVFLPAQAAGQLRIVATNVTMFTSLKDAIGVGLPA